MADGYITATEQGELLTVREQPTGRLSTRWYLSSYEWRQGMGASSIKEMVFTVLSMGFSSNVIITVERMSEQVLMELSKRQTYCRPYHLPCHRPTFLVDPSDPSLHWMSDNNELYWYARGGRNTQRNVNLSPGAAPETSRFSSRICPYSMGQC